MSKKVDARIARSKSSMAMALERLLQQKCLTDITVKDITDAAQLSKNTFYNNFSCKQDLLDYLLSGYADEVKELVAKGGPYKQEDKIMRFTQAISHILFTKIEEPEQAPVDFSLIKGALKFRHFALGALAIFLYMGVEVGTPNAVQQYLNEPDNPLHIPSATVGMIVAVYWFMMLIGRFTGAAIGSKVSSRAMVTTVATVTLCLVLFGMYAPQDVLVNFPGVDWGKLELIWQPIPVGIFAFLLVGLCTSVMWGAIFNMAVEGLGKYTAVASGIFMTMVFGCAVMMPLQGWVADMFGWIPSFWVVFGCAAYILFYALIGSRVSKRAE